ncbi:MAG: fumarylacetoacetate hydrolase family protein [Planctomycetes bacterium]|nr:fumarylacetoacetate hydrolase family protein [Planctomycetota bacterium]
MRLVRFGAPGHEKPGVVLSDQGHGDKGFGDKRRKDCSAHFKDWDHAFLQGGGLARLARLLADSANSLPDVPESERWGACVARPRKVICIGLNFSDHAAESGMPVPAEPIIFMKGSNTVIGPYDTVLIPRGSTKTDWEVELGVVIGRDTRYLASVADAAGAIAGYCVSNDVSERAFQLERGGQWTKGKSCDTFNPLGPWLSTSDEISDPQALGMRLDVNGARKQTGNTRTMVFGVHHIVHYLSQFMTLEAGDLISTGTPPGVGLGQKPPKFLGVGDVMELEIEGLGVQRQRCEAA